MTHYILCEQDLDVNPQGPKGYGSTTALQTHFKPYRSFPLSFAP